LLTTCPHRCRRNSIDAVLRPRWA